MRSAASSVAVMGIQFVFSALIPMSAAIGAEYGAQHPVRIVTTEHNGWYGLSLRNITHGHWTVTVRFSRLVNAATEPQAPYTVVVAPGETTEAMTVRQKDFSKPWDSYFMYDFQPGVVDARHDDSAGYRLPYADGESFRVGQGWNGAYTHKGDYRYAIDWDMPVGTEVLACRGGVVVQTEDSFDGGGMTEYYYNRNNQIIIEHADGTIARYVHFRKGGVAVRVGDSVKAGNLLGYSGNVGYSASPHLHFSVHRPLDGKRSESLPVRFTLPDGTVAELTAGNTYPAP